MKNLFFVLFSLVSVCSFAQSEDVKIDTLLLDVLRGGDFNEVKSVHVVDYKLTSEEQKDVVRLAADYKEFDVFVGEFSYCFALAMNAFHATGDSVFYKTLIKSEDYESYVQLSPAPHVIGFGGTYNYNFPLLILQHFYNNGLDNNIHFKALNTLNVEDYYSPYSHEKYNVQENYEGDDANNYSVKATLLKRIIKELSDSSQWVEQYFGGSKWVKKVIEFPFHFSDTRNAAYNQARINWVIESEKLLPDNHIYMFYGRNDNDIFYGENEINFTPQYEFRFVSLNKDIESNKEVKKFKNSLNKYDFVALDSGLNILEITSNRWELNNSSYRSYIDYEEDLQYQFVFENQQMDISGMKEILDKSNLNFYSGGVALSGMSDFNWVYGGSYRYGFLNEVAFGNAYKLRINQYSMFVGYNLLNTEYVLIKPEVNLGWSTKRFKYSNLSDSISIGPNYSFPIMHSFDSWSFFTKPMLNIELGYKALIIGGRIGYMFDFYNSKWDNGLDLESSTSGLVYDLHVALRIDN